MSDVSPISAPQGNLLTPPPRAAAHPGAAAAASGGARRGDKAEFSQMAQLLSKLQNLPIRQDLVGQVQDQIAKGAYETPEKLEAAINELLRDLK